MRNTWPPIVVLLTLLLLSRGAAGPHAQASLSPDAARDLVQALNRAHLDSIAAADPEEPEAFVAALHIPNSQLLVVSARHPSGEGLLYRLAMRQYREAYLDLQATPTPQKKFFVQDGALGRVDRVAQSSAQRSLRIFQRHR